MELKETGRPNFTISQTDTGYAGKGRTAAVHSRWGQDVSKRYKTSMECMLPLWRGQNIWVWQLGKLYSLQQ